MSDILISEFASSVDVSMATIEAQAIPELVDNRVVCELLVDASAIRQCFKFSTNSTDLSDLSSTDLRFYTNADGFRDVSASNKMATASNYGNSSSLGTFEGTIKSLLSQAAVKETSVGAPPPRVYNYNSNGTSYTVDNKSLVKDVMRNLAHEMFNTQYGVDIFNNESDLCGNFHNSVKSLVEDNGTIHNALTAADGVDVSNNTLVYKMFKHLVSTFPGRFVDISNSAIFNPNPTEAGTADAGDDGSTLKLCLPLLVGDTLRFKLTVNYNSTQKTVVGGEEGYPPRVYEVILRLDNGADWTQ